MRFDPASVALPRRSLAIQLMEAKSCWNSGMHPAFDYKARMGSGGRCAVIGMSPDQEWCFTVTKGNAEGNLAYFFWPSISPREMSEILKDEDREMDFDLCAEDDYFEMNSEWPFVLERIRLSHEPSKS